MLPLRILIAVLALAGVCAAQLPEYYKTVNRVTWVVNNLDRIRPAWEALGLTDVQPYVNIELTGQYRGKPVTIYAWQITGRLGNLTVDMIQPMEGHADAYNHFLSTHGEGILSIVHEVPSRQEMDREIARMKAKGVAVLQQVTVQLDRTPVTYTYFDTEPEGKFVLGLVYRPGGMRAATGRATVSHFGPVVWDAAAVSAYWAKLGYQSHTQADFLNKRRREGIQHIGVMVEDLAKAIAAYEKLGYRVLHSSGQSAYMNTDSAGGISVELVQRR